jgi:hypothetical protein
MNKRKTLTPKRRDGRKNKSIKRGKKPQRNQYAKQADYERELDLFKNGVETQLDIFW